MSAVREGWVAHDYEALLPPSAEASEQAAVPVKTKPARRPAPKQCSKPADPKAAKRRRFVAGLVNGLSMRRAALNAGYTETMANHAGEKILPGARQEFTPALAKAIPIAKLVQRIAQGLNANETKLAQLEGTYTDARTLVAWDERRRYAELVAKLLGFLVEKVELGGDDGGPLDLISAREKLFAVLAEHGGPDRAPVQEFVEKENHP